jgi:hypothetical protein
MGPAALLAEDIATMKLRGLIRAEVWSLLCTAGLVSGPIPPPEPKPRGPKKPNHLHVVRNGED